MRIILILLTKFLGKFVDLVVNGLLGLLQFIQGLTLRWTSFLRIVFLQLLLGISHILFGLAQGLLSLLRGLGSRSLNLGLRSLFTYLILLLRLLLW